MCSALTTDSVKGMGKRPVQSGAPASMKFVTLISLIAFLGGVGSAADGLFEHSSDVGAIEHKGSVSYDRRSRTYRITGSGANMWDDTDAFHFLWKKVSGDVSITTDIAWTTEGGNKHKKAGPILRAGLEPDDAYADIVAHGDGTLAFQFRRTKGAITEQVRTSITAPARLRLERLGDVISVEVAPKGGVFQPTGALSIALGETVYAGLAVCSHDAGVSETAVFSNVELRNSGVIDAESRVAESTLETLDIDSGQRHIVYRAPIHFEAPNWSRDGRHLFYNSNGDMYRISVSGGMPERIDTGDVKCNNDHGLSPDGKRLVISGRVGAGQSQIWMVSASGGSPRLITQLSPSYWHGWSPNGKTLAYCANRNGNFDVYTIPLEGGQETRLTTAEGLDDGPDYSPDGGYIYFNSERSGLMQIWRMKADGSEQELVSAPAESADWFAHPSPDGKWIVYLSYDKSVKGHPANRDVVLKLMPAAGGEPRVIATLFGGQGTINVPSWSPESRQVAFVSYRLIGRAGSGSQRPKAGSNRR